jgi:hypothetical protein
MMKQMTPSRILAVVCALALVLFTVYDASARRGGGAHAGRAGGFNRAGPAGRGSVGHHRAHHANRHANRRQAARYSAYDNVRDDRREFVQDTRRYRVGMVFTAAAFGAMTCQTTIVVVNGISYSQCGSSWYQRGYAGGSVTYVVVNAPPGY